MIGPFKIAWLLLGLAAPPLIGAAVTWLGTLGGWRKRDNKPAPYLAGAFGVIGVALASAVGILALLELPPWRPLEGSHWLFMAVLPAGLAVALSGIPKRTDTAVMAWLLRLIVVAYLTPLLTRPLIPYTWSQQQAGFWWIGLGVFGFLSWWLLRSFALRHGGRLTVFVLGAACGVLAAITMASGYLTGGQFAASPALALAGVWLAMLIRGVDQRHAAAVIDLAYPLFLGMLIYHWQFGWRMQHDSAPYVVAGLLAVAPLGIWGAAAPSMKLFSPRVRTLLALILTGLLLASASGLAGYEAMLRAQASSGYEYDY